MLYHCPSLWHIKGPPLSPKHVSGIPDSSPAQIMLLVNASPYMDLHSEFPRSVTIPWRKTVLNGACLTAPSFHNFPHPTKSINRIVIS